MIIHYIVSVIELTWWQSFQLFAMSFTLAIALQWVEG